MPMPNPSEKEDVTGFLTRFMGDENMKKEFPSHKQRIAVAYSKWKEKKEQAKQIEKSYNENLQ